MTVITGTQFRANQSKYIEMANRGERVILSSKAGYTELTPVPEEDEEIRKYKDSVLLLSISQDVRNEYAQGNYTVCRTPEEIKTYLDSL